MSAASFQQALAQFVASAPSGWYGDAAWPRVRLALLDTLAASVAAVADPATVGALRYARRIKDAPVLPPIWVTPSATTLEDAAFVAAVAAHALDYDDVAPAWRGHPSAVMLPALLALPRSRSMTGTALASAFAVGYEVGARIGVAVAGRHYEKGWHSTSTVGTIAATAACARLLKLDVAATSSALALAVAQAGGVQANFGTSAKAMHAGFAAAAALRACALAACGVDAAAHALEGPQGFADLMAGIALDADALADLGVATAMLVSAGIEVKLYPSCYATHRAIEAALALRERHAISADDIEEVEVEGSPGAHTPLLQRPPVTAAEARFSIEYVVACALLDGHVGLASFERDPPTLPLHTALMARTKVAEAGARGAARSGSVRLRLRDGRVLVETVVALRGYRIGGVCDADVLTKAEDCLRSVGARETASEVLAAIDGVREAPVAALIDTEPLARLRTDVWGNASAAAHEVEAVEAR